MNVWNFTGNLGQDAEMRATKSGIELCQFSVATRAGYGQNESTTWARCTLFGNRAAALAPYLLKGQAVAVSGEAKMHEWTNKAGETKTSLEVNVQDVTLMGAKATEGGRQPEATKGAMTPAPAAFEDEDIPF